MVKRKVVIIVLIKYTGYLYSAKENSKDMLNAHRYKWFGKMYKPKMRGKNPLEKMKGIDASGLPSCKSEVLSGLKRVAFVARMWANGDKPHIEQHPTENDGWTLQDCAYKPIWFDGPQLPNTVVPDEKEKEDSEESNASLESSSSDEEGDSSEVE